MDVWYRAGYETISQQQALVRPNTCPAYGVDMTDTTRRILDAARELVISGGSDAVSMRKVAAAIGVTPMALYRHFPNREALLSTVADECFADLAGQWSRVDLPDDLDEALRPGVAMLLDFALQQPRLYAFMFLEVRVGARVFPADFAAGNSPTFRMLTEVIDKGMRQGQLRPDDPWRVGLTLTATVHGLIQLHQGGRIGLDDADFRELCFDSVERIFNGLKAG